MPVSVPEPLDHDAFQTALGTVVAYGLILFAMFIVLFVLPFLLFSFLGVA
jgi:hypothetical protein